MPNLYYDSFENLELCVGLAVNLRRYLSDRELEGLVSTEPEKALAITAGKQARQLFEDMNGLVSLKDCIILSNILERASELKVVGDTFIWEIQPDFFDTDVGKDFLDKKSRLYELAGLLATHKEASLNLQEARPFSRARAFALSAFFLVFPFRLGKSMLDIMRA